MRKNKKITYIAKWIPDWKDSGNYLKRWEPSEDFFKGGLPIEPPREYRIAWEFLRRNLEFQKGMAHMLDLQKKYLMAESGKFNIELAKKFFLNPYAPLPHPHLDFPMNLIQILDKTTPRMLSGFWVERLEKHREYCIPGTSRIDMESNGVMMVPREHTQYLIMIDLTLPLKTQFDKAVKTLNVEQKAWKKSKLKVSHRESQLSGMPLPFFNKRNRKEFLLYLRVLDAKATGATHMEIFKVLFPDHYNKYQRGLFGDPKGKINAIIKVANRLRDGEFIYIPWGDGKINIKKKKGKKGI